MDIGYLVVAIPPTVLYRYFRHFTGVLVMIWSVIFRLFLSFWQVKEVNTNMQAKTSTLHPLGWKVRYWNGADKSISFIKLSTKTYLAGFCYDLNDIQGELRV